MGTKLDELREQRTQDNSTRGKCPMCLRPYKQDEERARIQVAISGLRYMKDPSQRSGWRSRSRSIAAETVTVCADCGTILYKRLADEELPKRVFQSPQELMGEAWPGTKKKEDGKHA